MSYSLYLYGSVSRGDSIDKSDVDILALFDSNVRDNEIHIPSEIKKLGECSDISLYSFNRIKKMYEAGHLFAWHLYKEAKFIGVGSDSLSHIGAPNEYKSFEEDTHSLYELLKEIPANLIACPNNSTYEAGLIYVCVRNVAMSSSYYAPSGLTFSTFAPFMLGYTDNLFPLSRSEYELLRQSRLAGTRGIEAPNINMDTLLSNLALLLAWCEFEIKRVKRRFQ